jgi:hydroxyacylglutathione hydrolase
MIDRQFGRIRFLNGENKGRYPFCHSVYIAGAQKSIVIDPACGLEKLNLLRDTEGVDEVLLSHWHEDHFAYLYLFPDCPMWVSQLDYPPLTDINILLDWYGIDSTSQRDYWRKAIQEQFHYQPHKEAHFIKDGEIIDCSSVTIEAIATPGHTPGHLSFFFREEKILFLGDYDLTSFGPWYGDVYSDIDETIKSIRRLQEFPAKAWITSHDKGLFEENPGELWQRYENIIYERERKILEYLRQPRTMKEIVSAWLIYGKPREPIEFFEFGERALLKKHLKRMIKLEIIDLDNDRYIARSDINC